MKPLPESALLLIDESELKKTLLEIDERMNQCSIQINKLVAEEDLPKGISFPTEIHDLKQCKLQLKYQHDFITAKLKRNNSF